MTKAKVKNEKKLREKECVKQFLKNCNIEFEETEVKSNEIENDVVDVFFQDKKFQIVSADFELQKLRTITPKDENGVITIDRPARQPNDVWRDFINNPILKKNKYGNSAKGVILLIDSYHAKPPWIENDLNIGKRLNLSLPSFINNLRFDEIYLVCPNKNIKVYPL